MTDASKHKWMKFPMLYTKKPISQIPNRIIATTFNKFLITIISIILRLLICFTNFIKLLVVSVIGFKGNFI